MKLTLFLVALCAAALLFFRYFTRNGAVPLPQAWRSFTVWLSAVGTVLGAYIVDLFAWVAGFWEPFRAQFGDLLAADSAGAALQILSAIFFLLRMKAQGAPGFPKFPSPDDTDAAGA
jgi:hypothetical protein